ncbi:hypothetical protein [Streptomyces chattanoogensis]|uniref:hypothetical protein n=1 Tax=Streptomyces chattanoogensis TaxID=66876 RepID=UPI000B054402|nr:hypothetical protein [Streptomyces chattanoogensis]
MSYQDPLTALHSFLADADHHDCPGCTLLKEQLSEVLQTQSNLALWDLLGNMTTPEE